MAEQHYMVSYRPSGASRHSVPADVCGTCSDFESGRLVPVTQCPPAAADAEAFYDYLNGDHPR